MEAGVKHLSVDIYLATYVYQVLHYLDFVSFLLQFHAVD